MTSLGLLFLGLPIQTAPTIPQEPESRPTSRPAEQAGTKPAEETLVNPRSFEKDGKLAESVQAWRTWARLKPEDPLPYREVLRLSLLMNKPQIGLEFGEKGLERFPKDLPLMLAMATAHMRLAELIAGGAPIDRDLRTVLEDAEFQAESALEISPRMREALAVLGMAQFRLQRYDDARETAKTLAKEHPKHHGGPFLLGEIAYRQWQAAKADPDSEAKTRFQLLGEARQAFMEASHRAPEKALPYRRLGDVSWWQGDEAQCLKWYAEGLARDPRKGGPRAWIDSKVEPFKRMDLYTKAAQKFAELSTNPAKDRALLLQGAAAAAYLVPNWKLCRSLSEEAYKLDSSWKDGLYYHAIASYALEDFDAAEITMGMYAVEAPDRLDATLRGGTQEQGRDLSDKLVFLAGKAFRKGHLLQSRAMNRALAEHLDEAESWNNYAFLCRETRAYEESYRAYQKALVKAPKDPRLLNDAAVILQYHLFRDLPKARKMYEEAILQAKRVLRDRSSSEAEKKEARQAISDATGNLKLLKKGKGKQGRK